MSKATSRSKSDRLNAMAAKNLRRRIDDVMIAVDVVPGQVRVASKIVELLEDGLVARDATLGSIVNRLIGFYEVKRKAD